MIVSIEQKERVLRISYIGRSKEVEFMEVQLPETEMFNWEYSDRQNGDSIRSWDKRPVYRKPAKYLNKYRIDEILMGLGEEANEKLFEFNVPNKWFVDIETEYDNGWAKAELATNRILTISVCDEKGHAWVLGIKPLNRAEIEKVRTETRRLLKDDSLEFEYQLFDSESLMLQYFFRQWVPRMSLVTGWNFLGYDWPYLYNRCKRLGIQEIRLSSPCGEFVTDQNLPVHRMVTDYMEIYKKWDRSIEVKENNSLDFVARESVGHTKVKMAKGLREMYEHDYVSYVLYNNVDSLLVQKVDLKINTMQTFLALANNTGVEYHRAFSPIYLTETVMNREFIRRGQRVIQRRGQVMNTSSYEGAYVKNPVPGMYRYVTLFDFESLYPKTQWQFNISPDSYLGKIQVDPDDKTKIRTVSGAVFDNSSDSCMRTVIKSFFALRKQSKKVATDAEGDIDVLKKMLEKIN